MEKKKMQGGKMKISPLSQREKFLAMTKEVDCENIEEFEKKIKKISRVNATASKNKTKK